MARRTFATTDIQTEGRRNEALNKRLSALEDAQNASTGITVTLPEPCTPDFLIATETIKGKMRGTFCALLPPDTVTLRTYIIRDADCPDQATFDSSQLGDETDVTDDARTTGHFEYRFGPRLEPNTLYRLVALVAIGGNGGKLRNPPLGQDILYTDPPLATFTTPEAFGAPSAPNSALIIRNVLDGSTRAFDALTTFRMYAPLSASGAKQSWRASGSTEAVFVIDDPDTNAQPHKIPINLTDTELDQLDTSPPDGLGASSPYYNRGYVEGTLYGEYPGAVYSWANNIAWSNGEKHESGGSPVSYHAAGLSLDPSTLTSLSLTITRTDPHNDVLASVDLNFTQPSTAVALKNVTVERKLTADSDSTYEVIIKKFSLKDDEWTTVGAHTARLADAIKLKQSKNYTLRTTIHAIGGLSTQFTTAVSTGTTDDIATPGALTFPVALIANTADGDPDKPLARVGLTFATVSGTFAANNITSVGILYAKRNDAGVLDSSITEVSPVRDAEASLTSINRDFYSFRMGQRYRIFEVHAINGHHHTITSGTLDFTAGNVRLVDPGDAYTVPAPTFQSQPATDGNKIANFTIRLTQDGSNIVFFKNLSVEISYGGGTYRHIEGSPFGLKPIDDLYASTTAFHDFVLTCKRKPGVTLDVRATAKAVGGKSSAATNATQLSASADDAADDTAVPSGLAAPTVRKLKKNGLKLDLTSPTSGNLKLRRANVYIANGDHSTATAWLSASDLTSSTATESVAAIQTSPTGGVVIPVDRTALEAVFGASATITIYATWTNDIGTSSFSSGATYNLATGETGAAGDDATAPSGLVAPTIRKLKRVGLKLDLTAPTSNNLRLRYANVYVANGSHATATTWLSAADLTSSTSTEASGAIQANPSGGVVIAADKTTLETVFGTGATITVYVTWTNDVGTSSFSSASTYNLATGESQTGVSDDAAAPGGTITAPTVRKLKKAALKLDLTPPTTNNLRLRRANVYIANGNHSTATTWLSAADLTSSTGTESSGAIQANPSGGVTIPVDRATLESVFGVSATITVYATWTNDVGTSSFSSGTTYNLANGENIPLGDSAVPTGLTMPQLDWTSTGKLRIRNMTFTAGNTPNIIKRKRVVVYAVNTTSGLNVYYNFTNNTTSGSEVLNDVGVGEEFTFSHAKLKTIIAAFRAAGLTVVAQPAFNLFAYWYCDNQVGTSLASATMNPGLVITSQVDYLSGSYDAVNVLDIGTTLWTAGNLIINGDFLFSDTAGGGSAIVNRWLEGVRVAAAGNIDTTTSTNALWDQTNHALNWTNNATNLYHPMRKRLVKNDYYAITFLARTTGTLGAGTVTVKFVNSNGGSPDTDASNSFTINASDLTSSYQLFGGVLLTDSVSDFTQNKWLRFSTSATLSSTNNVVLDKMMMVRGKQGIAYAPRVGQLEGDGTNPGSSEDVLVTAAASTGADLGTPSGGSQGGWTTSGVGRKVIPDTI